MNKKISQSIVEFFKDTHYAFIDDSSAIIFRGNKMPVIVDTKINLVDFASYLGAYFADGTKKGNSWAICISTFKQAKYYLKMHNLLVKDSKPEFTISYTNVYNINENQLKRRLAKIWGKEIGIKVDKFRIREPSGKLISKWNKYGTLVVREHRQILLDIYNTLLDSLLREILSKKDKKLALDFLCGVMEGDGSASSQQPGCVTIWTNKEDVSVLENILKVLEIKYNVGKKGKNGYFLNIGALEILRNLHFLKDKIFALYLKRRKILFERLKTVGATKFLVGNHEPTNWVKAWLRKNGFTDKNYKIIRKGAELRNCLLNEMENAGVKNSKL